MSLSTRSEMTEARGGGPNVIGGPSDRGTFIGAM